MTLDDVVAAMSAAGCTIEQVAMVKGYLAARSSTQSLTVVSACHDSSFNQFWMAYPCKKGKAVAEKAFRKVEHELDAIMSGLEQYKRNKPDYADWMHPTTFLNQRRWEDEYDAPVTGRMFNTQRDGIALLMQEAKRREDVAEQDQIAGNVVQLLPRADMERRSDQGEGGDILGCIGDLF